MSCHRVQNLLDYLPDPTAIFNIRGASCRRKDRQQALGFSVEAKPRLPREVIVGHDDYYLLGRGNPADM